MTWQNRIKILFKCLNNHMTIKTVTIKKINKRTLMKKITKKPFWINLMIGKESKPKWLRLLPNLTIINFKKMDINNKKIQNLKIKKIKLVKNQETASPWISTCHLLKSKVLPPPKMLTSEKTQNKSILK